MSTISSFVDEFADIVTALTAACSDNIIVCGDMNCPGPNDSSVAVGLADCFESLNLAQLVTVATRRTPSAANLLDVLATSSTALVSNVRVTDADRLSDKIFRITFWWWSRSRYVGVGLRFDGCTAILCICVTRCLLNGNNFLTPTAFVEVCALLNAILGCHFLLL